MTDVVKKNWEELKRVCNRDEVTVMAWLVGEAISNVGRTLEEKRAIVIQHERFPEGISVNRFGDGESNKENRQHVLNSIEKAEAKLRFLISVRKRLTNLHLASWDDALQEFFGHRAKNK